jgi:hypothetical protein
LGGQARHLVEARQNRMPPKFGGSGAAAPTICSQDTNLAGDPLAELRAKDVEFGCTHGRLTQKQNENEAAVSMWNENNALFIGLAAVALRQRARRQFH